MSGTRRSRLAGPAARALAATIWLGTITAQASAQDASPPTTSRESVLDGLRNEKALQTMPPQRSFVERWLYRYDQQATPTILGSWHGFHLASGSFAPGAGAKVGVGFDQVIGSSDADVPNRLAVSAIGAYGSRGYKRAGAGLDLRNVGGGPIDLRVGGQYYEYPQEDYFGPGPESRSEDRTSYLLESTDVDLAMLWKPAAIVELGAGGAYLQPRTASGTDSRYPSVESLFDPSSLPGFTRSPDFLRADVSAAIDWRDNSLHPHAGGRYGVRVSNFDDRERGAYDFRRVEIDLQHYVPLPDRYRTVALHASAVLTDADVGQEVPFFYQPTLGGSQTLRGFREFRFRDRNSLALSAEYRWEAWWALDGAFFVDAGTVAANRRDLSLRDLEVSYGVGFRLHSNRAFISRLDLAVSREGFVPMLRFEHVF